MYQKTKIKNKIIIKNKNKKINTGALGITIYDNTFYRRKNE